MSGWSVVGRYVTRTWSGTSSRSGARGADPTGGGNGAEGQSGRRNTGGSGTTSASAPQQHGAPAASGSGVIPGGRPRGRSGQMRRSRGFRIPTFFRRKFEIAQRGGGRVASGLSGQVPGSERGVAISEGAFREPSVAFRDPSKDPLPGSFKELKEPTTATTYRDLSAKDLEAREISFVEPELVEVGGYREPRYLDLFDPSVTVIRDPKLDLPKRRRHPKLRAFLANLLSCIASTRVIVGCAVVLLVLILVIAVIAVTTQSSLTDFEADPRVDWPHVTTVTSCGIVRGLIQDDMLEFRGVPYALPPTDSLRFRPAHPPTALDHCWSGTYHANITRPCWGYDQQGAVMEGDEDCLLLDVFTPKLGYDTPLPVVVYIGGNSLGGYSRTWLEPTSKVIVDRHFVMVIPQIRRGALGFLPHSLLSMSTYPYASGNQGASDLIAALIWVQHNVEHFGGDPERITLLGHEAGASLVWALVGRQDAARLFHFAWITGASLATPSLNWRQAKTNLAIESLGCSDMECLLSKSAEDIMEAIPLAWRHVGTLHHRDHTWLVKDGVILPNVPSPPLVPLVIGSTQQGSAERLLDRRDDLGSNQLLIETISQALDHDRESKNEVRRPQYRGYPPQEVSTTPAPPNPKVMLSWYSGLLDNPWLLLTTLVSDATVTCPALEMAVRLAREAQYKKRRPPVYSYLARHARASHLGGLADGLSDVEAIMGTYKLRTRSDARFVKNVQDLFFRFIDTGAPQLHGSTPANIGVYLLDDEVTIERHRSQCQHWRSLSQLARRE
ncbi:neurotactin-like [Oratosquilla oratoria]|uniref:neurotactin-like n=1 Tax=Oratosquilla oratoria TaxID=337810 RepID=UPI003F773116